jgi:TM2 domain-containing membrane protein YozV
MANSTYLFVEKNRKTIRAISASFFVFVPLASMALSQVIVSSVTGLISLGVVIGIGVLSFLLKKAGPIIGLVAMFLGTTLVPLIYSFSNELRYHRGSFAWLEDVTFSMPVVNIIQRVRYIFEEPTWWQNYYYLVVAIYVTASFVGFALLVFAPDKSLIRKTHTVSGGIFSQTNGSELAWIVALPGQQERTVGLDELRSLILNGVLSPQSSVRDPINNQYFSLAQIPGLYSRRSYTTALLISFFLGSVGLDRFYLGQTGLGIAKLLTLGGCGVWSLIDFIMIAMRKVTDNEDLPLG